MRVAVWPTEIGTLGGRGVAYVPHECAGLAVRWVESHAWAQTAVSIWRGVPRATGPGRRQPAPAPAGHFFGIANKELAVGDHRMIPGLALNGFLKAGDLLELLGPVASTNATPLLG